MHEENGLFKFQIIFCPTFFLAQIYGVDEAIDVRSNCLFTWIFSWWFLQDEWYQSLLCTQKRIQKTLKLDQTEPKMNGTDRKLRPTNNYYCSTYLRWQSHLFFFIDWTLELASSLCWLLKQRKYDKKMTWDQLLSTYCSSGFFFKGREIGGDSTIYLPHGMLQSKQWIKQRRKKIEKGVWGAGDRVNTSVQNFMQKRREPVLVFLGSDFLYPKNSCASVSMGFSAISSFVLLIKQMNS